MQSGTTDWNSIINQKAKSFKKFIKLKIGQKYFSLLEELSKDVDVFIFSGVVKDYLIGSQRALRDIDFTYRGKLSKKWGKIAIENFEVIKNRFGGFKLIGEDHFICDMWDIDKTYGVRNHMKTNPNDLLDSVFFNFTSIVFDFSSEKFIYDPRFIEFLENRKVEIINESNPDIELCFVNIYRNYKENGFELGLSVTEWAKENFEEYLWFDDVQQRHFHTLLYSNIELLNFISSHLLK